MSKIEIELQNQLEIVQAAKEKLSKKINTEMRKQRQYADSLTRILQIKTKKYPEIIEELSELRKSYNTTKNGKGGFTPPHDTEQFKSYVADLEVLLNNYSPKDDSAPKSSSDRPFMRPTTSEKNRRKRGGRNNKKTLKKKSKIK